MRDLAILEAVDTMRAAGFLLVKSDPAFGLNADSYHMLARIESAIDGLLAIGKVENTASLYDRARKAGITPMPTVPDIEYNHSIPLHV